MIWRRLAAGVLALFVLTGCAVQLAYDNVDRLARWFTSDFIDMNPAQQAQFDAGVASVWSWHRADHLPRYVDFLDATRRSLADGTDPEEIEALVNTVIGWAEEIESRSLPVAIDLLASLDEQQVGALRQRLAASNAKLADEEQGESLEASRTRWRKDTSRRFAQFVGPLTDPQKRYIDTQSVRYQPEQALWAEYRGRWQADLIRLLAARTDRPRFDDDFRLLAARREAYYGTELEAVWENNRSLSGEVAAWLLNNLTERQRARLDERLADLADELRALTDTPTDAPNDKDGGSGLACEVLTC
ncbi:MAG: DUF6279 family lipoprotein [Gammaproteobacteria bacterium]